MLPHLARRRFLLLLAALPLLLSTVASVYMWSMGRLEGKERTFWQALEWASETLTTTGYGADARWEHPAMVVFVIGMQFIGVFLVYMVVPFLLLPLLEERFERRLPRRAPNKLKDHVVIFRDGAAVETLIQHLVDAEVPVLILEIEESAARSCIERASGPDGELDGTIHVLYDRQIAGALEHARLKSARAVVANGSDSQNASVVLIARELGFTETVLALAEEPLHQKPLVQAGADEVITPRLVMAEVLATRASLRIQPRVEGIQQLGSNLSLTEVRVDPESDLAGKTLGEADLARKTGATVIGQWVSGSLEAEASAKTRIVPRGMLIAIGRQEDLDRLGELAAGPQEARIDGPLVVAGCGEVGSRVVELLRSAGEEVVAVDREGESTDVCGDIVDPALLADLDLEHAKGLVLALDNDASTLFATLILKERVPGLPVIVRVNAAENLDRIYRAQADFALSISQVAGQILARRLLGIDTLALDAKLQILKTSGKTLADRHPSELEIRERTGCSVVAVERGEEILTSLGEDFQFAPGDTVYVCGRHEGTERFRELYGVEKGMEVGEGT